MLQLQERRAGTATGKLQSQVQIQTWSVMVLILPDTVLDNKMALVRGCDMCA